jgi:histidine ammonia-lyase
VQSFAGEAGDKLAIALGHARVVTASELLVAYHAVALSGRQPPAGCRPVLDWLAGILGPADGDRAFGVDIERLIQTGEPPG